MGEVKFYRMDFKEDALEATELAVTDNPAIEITDGVMLKKDEFVNLNDKIELNKDKQIIASVALVADKWVERRTKSGESYFITFTPDQVRAFKDAFEANGGIINLNHTEQKIKAKILFSEIVGDGAEEKIRNEYSYKGKLSKTDYFVALKIEDEKDWEYLKANGFNSFSIQAYFNKNLIKFNKMTESEKLKNEIEERKKKLLELEKETPKSEEKTELEKKQDEEAKQEKEEAKQEEGKTELEKTEKEEEAKEEVKQEYESKEEEEEVEQEEETEDSTDEEESDDFEVTEEMYNALIEVIADLSAKVDEMGATPPVEEEEMTEEVEMTAVQKTANFLKGFNK